MRNYKYRYLYYILTGPSTITNGLPGLYFGQHSTNNLNDGYIGSGKLLKKYLKKHPNNYERHIVAFYNTKEELDKAEYEAIKGILYMPNVLNIIEGGRGIGNFGMIYQKNPLFNKGKNNPMYGKNPRDFMKLENVLEMNKNQSIRMKGYNNPMFGKGYLVKGEKNGCYGKKLMTNGIDRKYISPEEFDKYIKMGYHFGKK